MEARIREMEERLKQNGVTPAPVKTTQSQPSSPYTARTAAAEVAAAHDSSAVPPPQFEPTAATRRPQQPAQPPLRRPQPTQEEDEDDDEDDEEEESSEEDSDKVLPPRPIAKDYKDYASPRQQHQQFVQRTRGASVPMPKYASNASSARTGAAGARPGGAMPPTPVASEGEYEAQQQQNHLHRRLHPTSPTAISLSSSMHSEGDGGTASGPDDYADFVVVSKDGDDDN